LTREAFENAIRVNGAIGGSTNAVIHLLAIANRVGIPVNLSDWDELGHDVPCLVDLMPSGRFLMEDFCYAGGVPAVMKKIEDLLNTDALTVNGHTVAENLDEIGRASCRERVSQSGGGGSSTREASPRQPLR